jgi:NDP-sugar pyrophosphorylase family protein
MQAVILAAGKGERLRPLTLKRSKAMMPVAGKPMVERVMETLAAAGLRDFTLVMGEADADLAQHFEGRGVRLARQLQPLGAANALQCAAPFITDDFVLSACDNLVSPEDVVRLLEAWQAAPRPHAILTLMPMEPGQLSRSGVVALAPRAQFRREAARGSARVEGEWVTRIVEKPGAGLALSNLASLPLYCFSPRFLSYLADVQPSPRGEYELQDAIQHLIEREGRVHGLPVPSRLTLTDAADLLAINRHYLGVEPSLVEPDSVGANTRLIPPLRVEPGVSIGAGCQIGPNVYLEGNCQIGDGVKLRDVVALRGTTIAGGASLADQVLG